MAQTADWSSGSAGVSGLGSDSSLKVTSVEVEWTRGGGFGFAAVVAATGDCGAFAAEAAREPSEGTREWIFSNCRVRDARSAVSVGRSRLTLADRGRLGQSTHQLLGRLDGASPNGEMRQLGILEGAEAHPLVLPLAAHSREEGDVEDQAEDTVGAHDCAVVKSGSARVVNPTTKPDEDARNRGLADLTLTLTLKIPVPRSFQLPSFSRTYSLQRT